MALPPELLRPIFHFVLGPPPTPTLSLSPGDAFHRRLIRQRTALLLGRVCRAWYGVGIREACESLYVGSVRTARILKEVVEREEVGRFVKDLFLGGGADGFHLVELLKELPSLQGVHSLPWEEGEFCFVISTFLSDTISAMNLTSISVTLPKWVPLPTLLGAFANLDSLKDLALFAHLRHLMRATNSVAPCTKAPALRSFRLFDLDESFYHPSAVPTELLEWLADSSAVELAALDIPHSALRAQSSPSPRHLVKLVQVQELRVATYTNLVYQPALTQIAGAYEYMHTLRVGIICGATFSSLLRALSLALALRLIVIEAFDDGGCPSLTMGLTTTVAKSAAAERPPKLRKLVLPAKLDTESSRPEWARLGVTVERFEAI